MEKKDLTLNQPVKVYVDLDILAKTRQQTALAATGEAEGQCQHFAYQPPA